MELAEALGVSPGSLVAACALPSMDRIVRVRVLVRRAEERARSAHAAVTQNIALAAAAMLAKLATWGEDRVELDSRIVLGRNLLADRSKKYVRFDADGIGSVVVRRGKLVETGKALRFPDLTCWLDRSGLSFGWRAGRGGLRLVTQPVEARERDAVLSVVMERPRLAPVEDHPPSPLERPSNWLGDPFTELSIF
ncbi:MAG TPA: hypothetical protein VNG33_02890 [Polyangiaceae bacterium]|nr:hypothetical protein [Polyangiaceae bacterium]